MPSPPATLSVFRKSECEVNSVSVIVSVVILNVRPPSTYLGACVCVCGVRIEFRIVVKELQEAIFLVEERPWFTKQTPE